MSGWLIALFASLFGFFYPVLSSTQNDPYHVVGVRCGINEEVSCTMVECSWGQYCPGRDYCYNPTCVCQFGYRKINGKCVEKRQNFAYFA
ncbi:uncharacterized protein Dmoj_GI25869 [Drosophila mojavensis]|uniref:TIL domain-containing protein n=1 Tax=Drosophila mojavensis TaxID=7230 RepID=A0A0Q9XDB8_DROMO|nr:uncharacterized protein Dmoj_GI25869 [Drosophila mojavensis]